MVSFWAAVLLNRSEVSFRRVEPVMSLCKGDCLLGSKTFMRLPSGMMHVPVVESGGVSETFVYLGLVLMSFVCLGFVVMLPLFPDCEDII